MEGAVEFARAEIRRLVTGNVDVAELSMTGGLWRITGKQAWGPICCHMQAAAPRTTCCEKACFASFSPAQPAARRPALQASAGCAQRRAAAELAPCRLSGQGRGLVQPLSDCLAADCVCRRE